MKRLLLLVATLAFGAYSVNAQENTKRDAQFFNHMSVGLSAGTTGIGVDVAVPCTRFIRFRAGVDVFPPIKHQLHLDVPAMNANQRAAIEEFGGTRAVYLCNQMENLHENGVEVMGKTNMLDGKVLVDLYVTKKFCFTVGAFFGKDEAIKVRTNDDSPIPDVTEANHLIDQYNETHIYQVDNIKYAKYLGLELDERILTPDENGVMHANLRTWKAKPYVGLGFGRDIAKKRVAFKVDLGAKVWGKPQIYCNGTKLDADNAYGNSRNIVNIIGKCCVYPMISFRISGRLF